MIPNREAPPLPDNGQQNPLITSRRNPLVKQLRQLHTARGRREAGAVLLEGTHMVEEALRHGLALQRLVFTQGWGENHAALLAQVPPRLQHPVSEGVLETVATTVHPDGVVATALLPRTPWPRQPRFLLALDRIQDPGNLGALLRTALAAEADGVVLAQCAAPWQPKVLRAAADNIDPAPLRGLLHLGQAAEDIGDQARQMISLVEQGEAVHPILEIALGDSDEVVVEVPVAPGSGADGASLKELALNIEPGFTVLAIRRAGRYMYRPRGSAELFAGDEIIARGPDEGREALAERFGWNLRREEEGREDALQRLGG